MTSGASGSGSGSHGAHGISNLEAGEGNCNSGNDSSSGVDASDAGAKIFDDRRRTTAARVGDSYTDRDLYSTGSYEDNDQSSSSITSPFASANPSSTLLSSYAAWDFIQAHPLFKAGQLDIADVTDRLRKVVRCDGHGPGFEKADVKKAIEQSRVSSSDELI